jgi:hypothetical protein
MLYAVISANNPHISCRFFEIKGHEPVLNYIKIIYFIRIGQTLPCPGNFRNTAFVLKTG